MKSITIGCHPVDDNENWLTPIRRYVNESGFELRLVPVEDGGNRFGKDHSCDLILLKPDLSQWKWLDTLLNLRKSFPQIPIVLFSLDTKGAAPLEKLPNDPAVSIAKQPDALKDRVKRILDAKTGAPKRILFVDDDINILKSYDRMFRKSPFLIFTAKSAPEALTILRQAGADAVVTDIKMPNIHGLEFISEVRRYGTDTPIIVCSGFRNVCEEADMHFHGISAFIDKPADKTVLESAILSAVYPTGGINASTPSKEHGRGIKIYQA
ncbi:MAG: response regulator [Acidobacteria bacterium]|nr:response regulator [Acidobacteriota bacterium]